jgi:3-deoxy-manno-octulosonate cytidylyltransferase (CMP-KDO synthetase)
MKERLNFAGIVPARYASSRFPGKPLALIGDKTVIRMVYEQAGKALDSVFIATDDTRIFDEVTKFGGRVLMTSESHRSGTDRCAEAADLIRNSGLRADVIINIQGDEPFIRPEQIDSLKECFSDETVQIATLIRKVKPGEDISDPNQVKAVIDNSGFALYFSRAAIPFMRNYHLKEWTANHVFYKHIGLYAYRAETLKKITSLPQGKLEIAESLEQNRWLENGFRIKTALTEWENIGIDTPEDLEKARIIASRL